MSKSSTSVERGVIGGVDDETTINDIMDETEDSDLLTDNTVEEIAEETGLDENYVENRIKMRVANKKYRNLDEMESTAIERISEKIQRALKYATYIRESAIQSYDTPTTVTVTDITFNPSSSMLMLSTEHKQTGRTRDVYIHIEQKKEMIDYLLSWANVKEPSELEGNRIPVTPSTGDNKPYMIHVPTKVNKVLYKIDRFFLNRQIVDKEAEPTERGILMIGTICFFISLTSIISTYTILSNPVLMAIGYLIGIVTFTLTYFSLGLYANHVREIVESYE